MSMLRTKIKPRLTPRDELDDPTECFSQLLLYRSLHRSIGYEDKNAHLDLFTEVYALFALGSVRDRFMRELRKSFVMTFDLEGAPGKMPDGILLQPLGGTCVYINVFQLLSGCSLPTVRHELRFIFNVLADPRFIKLGSGCDRDLDELAQHFGIPQFIGNCHIFGTREIFEWNKENGLYDPELISPENIGQRYGLGVLSLLHCGADHKVYDRKSFLRHHKGTLADWDKFPSWRKIDRHGCDMYNWKRWNLEWYQRIYGYQDCTTVLRFFVDSVHFAMQGFALSHSIDPDLDTYKSVIAKYMSFIFGDGFVTDRFGPNRVEKKSEAVKRPSQDTPDHDGVACGSVKRALRLEDDTNTYTHSELYRIEKALDARAELLGMDKHPDEINYSNVFQRNVDEEWASGLKAVLEKNPKCTGKTHFRVIKRGLQRFTTQQTKIRDGHVLREFYEENPVLGVSRCLACGMQHLHKGQRCPVMRYHLRKNAIYSENGEEVPAGFFALFPCTVCTSVHHTTVMCPVLHRLCTKCHVRGHAAHECNLNTKRERFEKYSQYGLLTQTAEKREDAPFGFSPNVPWEEQSKMNERLIAFSDTYDVREIYNKF